MSHLTYKDRNTIKYWWYIRGNKKHVNSKTKSIKKSSFSVFFIRGNWQAWREYKQQRCRHFILTRIVFHSLFFFTVKMPMNLCFMTSIFIKQVYRFFWSFFSLFFFFIIIHPSISTIFFSPYFCVFSFLLKTTSS